MYPIIFLLGTIFGSLGSVLTIRLEKDTNRSSIKSILFGFSKCPHCNKKLKPKNLIPIISFLLQKGKCSFCKRPISIFYPLLELASGIIFMFSYYIIFDSNTSIFQQTNRINFFFLSIMNRGFLLLIFQDIKKQELHIPIRIITTGRIIFWQLRSGDFLSTILSGASFTCIFIAIYFLSKKYISRKYKEKGEGFGQGDIYLGFSLGAAIPFIEKLNNIEPFLGNHLKIITSIIFMASILGLIYALIAKILNKQNKIKIAKQTKTIIPFFPTLILSFRIMLIFGDIIIYYLFL